VACIKANSRWNKDRFGRGFGAASIDKLTRFSGAINLYQRSILQPDRVLDHDDCICAVRYGRARHNFQCFALLKRLFRHVSSTNLTANFQGAGHTGGFQSEPVAQGPPECRVVTIRDCGFCEDASVGILERNRLKTALYLQRSNGSHDDPASFLKIENRI